MISFIVNVQEITSPGNNIKVVLSTKNAGDINLTVNSPVLTDATANIRTETK